MSLVQTVLENSRSRTARATHIVGLSLTATGCGCISGFPTCLQSIVAQSTVIETIPRLGYGGVLQIIPVPFLEPDVHSLHVHESP